MNELTPYASDGFISNQWADLPPWDKIKLNNNVEMDMWV